MPFPSYDPNHPAFSAALEDLRAELEAIPSTELAPVRLEVTSAVITALGVAPKAKRFRDAIVAELGEAAAAPLDRLVTAAQACGRAQGIYLTSIRTVALDEKVDELSRIRRVLLLEAQGLVAKKRLAASSLAEIVGGIGYKALCLDVVQLVSALRADWSAIEAHTPVTSLELDRAEALANAVAMMLGEIEQSRAGSPTAELRQRAYTHFVRTYEEVRRAITFVRWKDGDADEIAPSLFAGRQRRREGDDEDAPVAPPIVTPITPVAGPTNGPSPVTPIVQA